MTYSYAQARDAVAKVNEISVEDLPALRARVHHTHRHNGGAPGKPGQGRSAQYSLDDVFLICLELRFSALGVSSKIFEQIRQTKDFAADPDGWVIYRKNPFQEWTLIKPGNDPSFVSARVDHIRIDTSRLRQEIAKSLGDIEGQRIPLTNF